MAQATVQFTGEREITIAKEMAMNIAAELETIVHSLAYDHTIVTSGGTFDTYNYAGGSAHINRRYPNGLADHLLRTAQHRCLPHPLSVTGDEKYYDD